jgi:hypothetical protein
MAQLRHRQSQRKSMSSQEVQTQLPEVVDQALETHEKKSPQESFAELRKAKEDLERQLWQAQKEREMYEKQMQMQAQYQQKQTSQEPEEEEYDYRQLEQQEFPDGKNIAKAFNQFNKKLNEKDKRIAEANQKLQVLETATEFADFKTVVTPENIEKYIRNDEDNQEAVQKAANPLRKVYSLIKKELERQELRDFKTKASVSQEQKRVDEKDTKPKLGSLGVRSEAVSAAAALSNSKMSRQEKAALWKETLAASRK